MHAQAIIVRRFGDPDVLEIEEVHVTAPAAGQIQIRQTAIGVDFHDIYVRSGLYRTLTLPGTPGLAAVGIVEAVGAGVMQPQLGERVVYIDPCYGGYAERRVVDACLAVSVPPEIDDRTMAALFVKALTVDMLLRRIARPARDGDICLIHAAAGGVGTLLCQQAKAAGARVIGTVGSERKADLARQRGCDEVILYKQEDFAERVRELTDGRGADIIYDSVGNDTFRGSLASLALRGHLVSFGQSSGPIPPFLISDVAAKSNSISRPILFHYIAERATLVDMAQATFDAWTAGTMKVEIGGEFPLAGAAAAHRAMEARQTLGSTILIP